MYNYYICYRCAILYSLRDKTSWGKHKKEEYLMMWKLYDIQIPMSINMVVLEYSHCGSFAYYLHAEIEFNGCKRLHMTCKTKILTGSLKKTIFHPPFHLSYYSLPNMVSQLPLPMIRYITRCNTKLANEKWGNMWEDIWARLSCP